MASNKKGFSVLMALGLLVVVTIIAVVVQVLMNSGDRGQKAARVRFAVSLLENRIRLKLNMPGTYSCTKDTATPPEITCSLPPNFWSQFVKSIPGAKCPAGTPVCGLRATGPLLVKSTTLPLQLGIAGAPGSHVRIDYNGTDMRMNSISIFETQPFDIPSEAIANSATGMCGADQIFKGIQKDGTALCVARPSCLAQPGKYFAGLDSKGQAICKTLNGLTTNSIGDVTRVDGISCPKAADGSDQYISAINFVCSPGAKSCSIQRTCKSRIDPCNVAGSSVNCPAF